MKKTLLLPAIAACLCWTTACSDPAGKTGGQSMISGTEATDNPDSAQNSDLEKMKQDYRMMLQHLTIAEDSTGYIFDLTEAEAVKAGIDKIYYDELSTNIKFTNASIRESINEGEKIELTDPQELIKNLDIF